MSDNIKLLRSIIEDGNIDVLMCVEYAPENDNIESENTLSPPDDKKYKYFVVVLTKNDSDFGFKMIPHGIEGDMDFIFSILPLPSLIQNDVNEKFISIVNEYVFSIHDDGSVEYIDRCQYDRLLKL